VGIVDLHHVAINVTDLDRSIAFYTDVLGFSVLPREGIAVPGAWLDVGSGRQIHLVGGTVPDDVGQHVAFVVDDLDTTVAELTAAGQTVKGPVVIGPRRQAFLFDPDGNRLEINEALPSPETVPEPSA
jgi:glyoxylase I family protein